MGKGNECVGSINGWLITGLKTALHVMNTTIATLTPFTKWWNATSCVSDCAAPFPSQFSQTSSVDLLPKLHEMILNAYLFTGFIQIVHTKCCLTLSLFLKHLKLK
jgi:hypothetical protein